MCAVWRRAEGMFSMSLQSHIVPRKCHSALGRQRSEARLICLTAFTEMFCGQIQRSLGGVPLHFVCPRTPLAWIVSHKTYDGLDLSATKYPHLFWKLSYIFNQIHIFVNSSLNGWMYTRRVASKMAGSFRKSKRKRSKQRKEVWQTI